MEKTLDKLWDELWEETRDIALFINGHFIFQESNGQNMLARTSSRLGKVKINKINEFEDIINIELNYEDFIEKFKGGE